MEAQLARGARGPVSPGSSHALLFPTPHPGQAVWTRAPAHSAGRLFLDPVCLVIHISADEGHEVGPLFRHHLQSPSLHQLHLKSCVNQPGPDHISAGEFLMTVFRATRHGPGYGTQLSNNECNCVTLLAGNVVTKRHVLS